MRFRTRVVDVFLVGVVACVLGLGTGYAVDNTPYVGGFGAGFLNLRARGAYGGGEIRSGDVGLRFNGESFGGDRCFDLYVRHSKGEWNGGLVDGAPGLKIEYLPSFPKCQYKYKNDTVPLNLKLDAFAPWIPGDSKMCSLPVVLFDFEITNPDAQEQTVALSFGIPSPGCEPGKAIMDKDGKLAGVLLKSGTAGGGTLCGMVRNDGNAEVTFGDEFAKGKLTQRGGALNDRLASSIVVPAGATRHIVFILAWDFPVYVMGDGQKWPRKELGHYHNNFYNGADAIAQDCRSNYPAIRASVDGWVRRMWDDSNLPEWMRRQILISTSHMAYNGVFFKNGQAAMRENNGYPQAVGTYDEQFFCGIAQLIFLPEADWGTLDIFAKIPTPEGAIRHDLGMMVVTAESKSEDHSEAYPGKRTGYWDAGDNTAMWILDLYRDYLWTGQIERMKALWPTATNGCAYLLAGDKDNNGLYDNPKTYDCFGPMPENMFINDLQRAAFQAAARMADIMGDKALCGSYQARSELMARKIEEFWNPKGFYGAAKSQPDNPMATALLGEHSDDLLCLPRQLNPDRVRQHLKYMGTLGHNFNGKTFQVMEKEVPGGWITELAMSNAENLRDYCALALWRGCTKEGMDVAKCFYDVIFEHLKREWDQTMLIDMNRNSIFGEHYMSIPAAWHLLLGLEGLSWDVPRKKLWIRPNLPESFGGKLKAFLPGAVTWGGLDYSTVEKECDQKLVLTFERPFELKFLGVRNTGTPKVQATVGGKKVRCSLREVSAEEYEIHFTPPLHVDTKPLEIRVGKK